MDLSRGGVLEEKAEQETAEQETLWDWMRVEVGDYNIYTSYIDVQNLSRTRIKVHTMFVRAFCANSSPFLISLDEMLSSLARPI
jgi:hypothetical protein